MEPEDSCDSGGPHALVKTVGVVVVTQSECIRWLLRYTINAEKLKENAGSDSARQPAG